MRKILRRRDVVSDDWQHWGEATLDSAAPARASQVTGSGEPTPSSSLTPASTAAESTSLAGSLIVPFAELRQNAATWQGFQGRLGVSLKPADKVEDLASDLPRLALVAVEFPNPGDGRAYTQARLLRERYKFTGEIRAIGAAVKRDLLFFMARSGVDSFELAAGEDFESAQHALRKYDVAYQPGAPTPSIQRQRFFA